MIFVKYHNCQDVLMLSNFWVINFTYLNIFPYLVFAGWEEHVVLKYGMKNGLSKKQNSRLSYPNLTLRIISSFKCSCCHEGCRYIESMWGIQICFRWNVGCSSIKEQVLMQCFCEVHMWGSNMAMVIFPSSRKRMFICVCMYSTRDKSFVDIVLNWV